MKEIRISQGKVALVDDDMFEQLNKFKWSTLKSGNNFYAVRMNSHERARRKLIGMHHFLLPPIPGFLPDHIDGNGLHNWRDNLRYVTYAQNVMNTRKHKILTSHFKGVSLKKSTGRWCATIGTEKKHKHLGYYHSEIEAALAYNQAAIEYFGEFANINRLPAKPGGLGAN